MTRVVTPRCKLCGTSDPYLCPTCDEWFCASCMGPRGQCTHRKHIPVQSDPDWEGYDYDDIAESAPIDAEDLRGKTPWTTTLSRTVYDPKTWTAG